MKTQERTEAFCRAYARTYNQTEAALEAGYGVKKDGTKNRRAAAVQGARLMKDPAVRERVDELMTHAADEAGATRYYIAETLKTVVDRCMEEKPVRVWDRDRGEWVDTGETTFSAAGASRALSVLADIQGMKRTKIEGEMAGKIEVEWALPKEMAE